MGMEGKLRQISEFELAAYRRTPAKLYSDLLARHESESYAALMGAAQRLQELPAYQRLQERVAAGLGPAQEDLDAIRKEQEKLLEENQGVLEEVQSETMGLSKDGSQLSLYKDWHILHYVLTGKSWEPVDTSLGKAIMGGTKISDRQKVMGNGPARYLTPAEVREVAQALSDFAIEEKIDSFDPKAAEAARVYPSLRDGDRLDKEGFLRYFALLRDFYEDAASKGNAMILWIV